MATWKKIVVSGSNLSQLNDDIGLILNSDTGSIALGGELGGTISSATVADNIIDEANLKVSNSGVDGYILSFNNSTGGFTWLANTAAANDTTITLSPGAGIAAIGDFTTNQGSPETLTIGVDGVLEDLDTLGAAGSDGQFIVATGAGAFAYESGATVRTSLGLGNSATQDTGSMTVATADSATSVAANSVALGTDTTGNYVETLAEGTGIDITGADAEGATKTIAVDVSDFMTNGADNRVLTATGTDAQNAEANLTFNGSTLTVTGNATITGDLTVTGDTIEQQVTNLNVEDQFILINSGSAAADAGFVVNGQGSAFGWDESENRWAFDFAGATWNQTSITTDAFAAAVVTTDDANYQKVGNIRIDGDDIYIYS